MAANGLLVDIKGNPQTTNLKCTKKECRTTLLNTYFTTLRKQWKLHCFPSYGSSPLVNFDR